MPTKEYLIGLGEMYVADPRFGATYDRHGEGSGDAGPDGAGRSERGGTYSAGPAEHGTPSGDRT